MEGFKTYRHKNNPKEKELHDKFVEKHIKHKYPLLVDLIVFPVAENHDFIPSEELSIREKRIMISTIQWLGSPVGQDFLRECGFELKEK